MDLYEEPINLYSHKNYSTVCGWGSVTKNDNEYTEFENAENAEDLHCMTLELHNKDFCRRVTPMGDYRRRLLCGLAAHQGQITTVVIITKYKYLTTYDTRHRKFVQRARVKLLWLVERNSLHAHTND